MNNEEAIECIRAIRVQMFNDGKESKWTKSCDMAIKALYLVSRLDGFKYLTTEVFLRELEVAHFDIYKRGWNDAIQAVIDASDMPVMDIIKAIKENELKEAEND